MPHRPAPIPARRRSVASTIQQLCGSFERSLLASNKSQRTVETYTEAVRLFDAYLAAHHLPQQVSDIEHAHVEGFIIDLLKCWKPATAHNRFEGVQQFFRWAVEEDEIPVAPMVGMRPPIVPETPPPILTEIELRKLLKVCEGKDFRSKRDTAIIRLFLDTGMRVSELAGLRLDDLDLSQGTAAVFGKGRRPRICPFGHKTVVALDRYLRARAQHPYAHFQALWLGVHGPMSSSGVYQTIRDRAEQAGLPPIHPHMFRHAFAHHWLAAGGQESDLMRLAGWRSRAMLTRYAASLADQRARQAHKQFGPGDRV